MRDKRVPHQPQRGDMFIENADQVRGQLQRSDMVLDSFPMMSPRWGCSSIDDGSYKHFAPLELAKESIRLIQCSALISTSFAPCGSLSMVVFPPGHCTQT